MNKCKFKCEYAIFGNMRMGYKAAKIASFHKKPCVCFLYIIEKLNCISTKDISSPIFWTFIPYK